MNGSHSQKKKEDRTLHSEFILRSRLKSNYNLQYKIEKNNKRLLLTINVALYNIFCHTVFIDLHIFDIVLV